MSSKSEHIFFQCSAIWYVLTVFWGFAPSFYLSRMYEDFEPLPLPLVLHGITFTLWVALYAVQVFLIRSKKYRLHQTLGVFGLLIMLLMIPTGLFPVVYKYHAGLNEIAHTGHNVFRLFSGYTLFALAIIYRKKSFFHKRLMLGCMVMLMSAAIFRISLDLGLEDSQLFNKGFQILPAVALFIFDWFRAKRLVYVDLISPLWVLCIFFFASQFWLTGVGSFIMDILISIFVLPFI